MSDLWVLGGVCAADKKPYVEISEESRVIAQMSAAEARRIAHDLLEQASRAEADAMLYSYCGSLKMKPEATTHVINAFREFRDGLDKQPVAEKTT